MARNPVQPLLCVYTQWTDNPMGRTVSVQVQFRRRKMLCLWFKNGGQSIFTRQVFSGISIKQADCCTGDCRRCDGGRCFIVFVSARKSETAQSYIDKTGAGENPAPRRFCQ